MSDLEERHQKERDALLGKQKAEYDRASAVRAKEWETLLTKHMAEREAEKKEDVQTTRARLIDKAGFYY